MTCGVIFDVDGTLVDSVDLHARAWQDAFAEFGHRLGFQAIRSQIGKGGDQLMPVFLSPDEMKTLAGPLEKRRSEILKQRYMISIRAFPRVRQLVQRLQARGVRVALASSAKAEELQIYKKLARIDDLIPAETTSDDAARSKPHPDIFEAALARLGGVARESALVIGDSPYDAQAAASAGLRAVGVLCGGFSEQELRRAGCVAIFRDPSDVYERLHQLPFENANLSLGGDAMSGFGPTSFPSPGASQPQEPPPDLADRARASAATLAGDVGRQAAAAVEAQNDKAADALEGVAKAIHHAGAGLEGEQDWAARLVEKGAAELNVLASALRRNDMQGLIDNLADLARRQPAVLVGASFAAGFLLTRIGRLAAEAPAAEAPHGQA